MYRSIRITRIVISLIAMGVPTWALVTGYDSVFVRMQILTALLTGVGATIIFWAIITLVYGRIYCSTVCPLGTLIDCATHGTRMLQRQKQAHYRFEYPYRRTRVFFLILAMCSLLSGTILIPTLLDPYSAYARIVEEFILRPLGIVDTPWRLAIGSISAATVTLLGIIAVAWRKRGRLICNTVCPVGIVLGYGSRRPVFHMEIDPDRCINCGECERVCKAQCVKLPEKVIDHGRCVVCFDCAAACPTGAMTYRSGRFRLDIPMMMEAGGTAQSGATSGFCDSLNNKNKP